MWTADEEFVDLSAPAKVLALWSITSPQTNWAGVFPVSKRAMSNETGLNTTDLDASLAELERFEFAFYEKGVLWIRTRARRIAKRGKNMVKAIVNDLEVIDYGHPIRVRFIEYYRCNRDLGPALATLSGPPSDTVEGASDGDAGLGSTKGNGAAPSEPPSEGSYVNGSVGERTTERTELVLARLRQCARWSVNDIDDRMQVERLVLATPQADHDAAAIAAVRKGDDPKWRTRTAWRTFEYALREQADLAAPKAEADKPDPFAKYATGREARA